MEKNDRNNNMYILLFMQHVFIFIFLTCRLFPNHDLSIVGNVCFADGLGRQSIGIAECLHNVISINYLGGCKSLKGLENVAPAVRSVFLKGDKTPGNVIFYETLIPESDFYKRLPKNRIRIAYSMTESTQISPQWAHALNTHFDVVAVPSQFLIDVFKQSGVVIPIYCLPLGVYLNPFFSSKKSAKTVRRPFVFGSTECLVKRKNLGKLIQAFIEVFGNNPDVVLRLNGRNFWMSMFSDLKKMVEVSKVKNIELTEKTLGWDEYVSFMASLDCLVNISFGEGYSIIPREAMAMGIPCLLTNNFAQKELCDSGFVKAIVADIPYKANSLLPSSTNKYGGGEWLTGYCYDCSLINVKKGLQEMYANYEFWFSLAQKNREWVRQFTWEGLQKKYLMLVKPKKIVLGNSDSISDECLETKSVALYAKYKQLGIGITC